MDAAGLLFYGHFYGFAHGWMTSQVAQFGGVLLVALAAGGFGRRSLLVVAEPHR